MKYSVKRYNQVYKPKSAFTYKTSASALFLARDMKHSEHFVPGLVGAHYAKTKTHPELPGRETFLNFPQSRFFQITQVKLKRLLGNFIKSGVFDDIHHFLKVITIFTVHYLFV